MKRKHSNQNPFGRSCRSHAHRRLVCRRSISGCRRAPYTPQSEGKQEKKAPGRRRRPALPRLPLCAFAPIFLVYRRLTPPHVARPCLVAFTAGCFGGNWFLFHAMFMSSAAAAGKGEGGGRRRGGVWPAGLSQGEEARRAASCGVQPIEVFRLVPE